MLNLDKISLNIENLPSIFKSGETHRAATHADCLREGRGKSFKPGNPRFKIRDCVNMNKYEKCWAFSKFAEGFQDKVHWFHVSAP